MEATKAGQSEITKKLDEGFNGAEVNASERHDYAMSRFAHLESIIMESVIKSEKNHQELLEETKAAKSMGTRQLFLETSDNHNNNNAVADSALTDTTSATSAAQRQLQKVKQMKRELDAKQKRMKAQHEEKERSLDLHEKSLSEKYEKKADKKIRDAKKQYDEKMRGLQSKNDQMKRELALKEKEFNDKMALKEKENEIQNRMTKPAPEEPPKAELKAINEHNMRLRRSRVKAAKAKAKK